MLIVENATVDARTASLDCRKVIAKAPSVAAAMTDASNAVVAKSSRDRSAFHGSACHERDIPAEVAGRFHRCPCRRASHIVIDRHASRASMPGGPGDTQGMSSCYARLAGRPVTKRLRREHVASYTSDGHRRVVTTWPG